MLFNSGKSDFLLKTNQKIKPAFIENVGLAHLVKKNNFNALDGVTCFTLELWEACMRLPHWHPNASELGYVISGTLEVIIWRSPGETATFTVAAGMCWFIPKAALHSLNNIGKEKAKLLVGFSTDDPADIDLPVAYHGIPAPVRNAYCSPHSELRQWQGPDANPLVGRFHLNPDINKVLLSSPYGFDFAKVTPLFLDKQLGSVVWGVKSNWNILAEISILRAHLKPNAARDVIWYPDVGTLYVVSQGKGIFHIITAEQKSTPLNVEVYDYIYVPIGVLHTFYNPYEADFEVIALFTGENPQPEVSLSVATGFFPVEIRNAALTHYGNNQNQGAPLTEMKHTSVSPYLVKIEK